jgi:hypothetical protein
MVVRCAHCAHEHALARRLRRRRGGLEVRRHREMARHEVKSDRWGLWLHVRGYKVRLRLDPTRLVLGVLYIWRGSR